MHSFACGYSEKICKCDCPTEQPRAIAFANQKIIKEVQEEIISSWWVQGKAP